LTLGSGLAWFATVIGAAGCDGSGLVLAFLGGLFSMGLFGTLVSWIKGEWGASGPPPLDAAPADGVVEVVPILGLSGMPNRRDARFRRFRAVEAAPGLALRSRRRPGRSEPPLLGRVMFASLFLDRGTKPWSDEEIARTLAGIVRAGEWIEREAMRRGATVNVEVADVYFAATDPQPVAEVAVAVLPEGEGEGLYDADAEVRLVASASRGAAALGFRDVADLAAQVASRVQSDAIVWLIHPRAAGRSFVVPERETGMRGVSLAICYAREDDFPGPLIGPPYADPATFAHEVLHLFGATDKYGVPLSRFPEGTVTGRDIMRMDVENLSRLRVDSATAREIGWEGSTTESTESTEKKR
jgi:hypothetical protein